MQKNLQLIFVGLLVFTLNSARAVPAYPGLIEYAQPDGSIIEVSLVGDENCHYYISADGQYLMPDASGMLQPVDSNKFAARKKNLRQRSPKLPVRALNGSLQKKGNYLYSEASFPLKGETKTVVVLVDYPDVKFSMDDPYSYFDDFLNGEEFRADNATGSCRQFFIDNSNGIFMPHFDLYGPVTMKYKRDHYGKNDADGNDEFAHEMVIEAVEALDDTVDFSQYDLNGDGLVDNIYIIYAGRGEADGGGSNTVWPYSWELLLDGVELKVDGVTINSYGVSNEVNRNNVPAGIGTFVHEFGHVLGFPDIYNTVNPYGQKTPGSWSTMDQGSYNNDSRTPPNLSAFERYSLGWTEPEWLCVSGLYSLLPMSESGNSFIFESEENPDEFFILENRQLSGWDAYLPHHGMLVWHINFKQETWDYNSVNDDPNDLGVDLVRADNTWNSSTYPGDPFPGLNKVTTFSNVTHPSLLTHSGQLLNVRSISDIKEDKGVVTFKAHLNEERAGVTTPQSQTHIKVIGRTVYSDVDTPIFNLSGIPVGTATKEGLLLPPGLYITPSKKLLIP